MLRMLGGVVFCLMVAGCSKKEAEVQAAPVTPPPIAQSAKVVAQGKVRFAVAEAGTVSVSIDAPDEKFRGATRKLSGVFDVDLQDIAASTGEVVGDLDAFVTSTFQEPERNETQTEHAKNWFQLGAEVEKAQREDFRMARFSIEKIEKASVKSAAEAKGAAIRLTAKGTLRLHGRPSPKTVEVDVTFLGPPDAPTRLTFKTVAPFAASLSEHDVKPRDIAGRFLAGTLEKIGKKLEDKAQVSVDGTALIGRKDGG